MNINEVLRDARKNRGGTYFVSGYDVEGWHLEKPILLDGYWVAVEFGIENVPDMVLTRELVSLFITAKNVDQYYLGLWQDERGHWSLDGVIHSASLTQALSFARLNNQRAIWDIGMSESVAVN